MVKIEAYVQPFRLDAVKAALDNIGVEGASYFHVMDCGSHLGLKTCYRGSEYRVDSPRLKVEVLVDSPDAGGVIDAVSEAARTGVSTEDGLIVVSEVAEAIRIKNGRRIQVASR